MATSRDSSATAATRTRARTCSRRSVAIYNDNELLGIERNHCAVELRHRPSALPADRASSPISARHTRRCASGSDCLPRPGRKSRACSPSPRSSTAREVLVAVQHVDQADRAERSSSKRRSQRFTALAGRLPRDGVGAGQRAHHASAARLCGVRCSLIRRRPRCCASHQTLAVVAGRRNLPDLSAQLRGLERRRHRRPARDHAAARLCRAAWVSTAIWLSPFFTSPMNDFGYDVADYCGVDPVFGTLADFDALVARAHALGLKVIIDQVYSHSSDQHPWFQESRSDRAIIQGRLVRLGRRQAGRLAAQQLAVGVRRPGLDLGRAARPILPAQFPATSSRSSTCTIRRVQDALLDVAQILARPRRRRLPHRCDQLRDARPAAARQSAGAERRQAHAAVRLPAASLQPVAPGHREVPRAAAGGDRQLRRPLHPGRSRRRARAERDESVHRRAMHG